VNWDDARILIALSREGSLRAAGRTLGINQATVGRRLAILENALGAKLFLKRSDGYILTGLGEAALFSALAMEQSALELLRRIQGQDSQLSGMVRVTSTDSVAQDFVVPAIARLHKKHPEVQVQLHSSTTFLSLVRRETDIAVRNVKPDNPDLIVRRLATWPVGLFATQEYLDRMGEPAPGESFLGHDLVVYQPYLDNDKSLHLVQEPIECGRIVATASSSLLVRRAILAGLGLGELPIGMATGQDLVRVWPDRFSQKPYEMWLVTHEDLRQTARIRAVIDELMAEFASRDV
jgi:DNA-binding transcriptional LysR family regulator